MAFRDRALAPLDTPFERGVHSRLGLNVRLEDGKLIALERKSVLFYANSLLELAVEAAGGGIDIISRSIRGRK